MPWAGQSRAGHLRLSTCMTKVEVSYSLRFCSRAATRRAEARRPRQPGVSISIFLPNAVILKAQHRRWAEGAQARVQMTLKPIASTLATCSHATLAHCH